MWYLIGEAGKVSFTNTKKGFTMSRNYSIIGATAVSIIATGAFAGGISKSGAPMQEPRIMTVASPAAPSRFTWTGAYVGAMVGYGQMDFDTFGSGSGATAGLFAGYRQDLGNFVLGGEVVVAPTTFGSATLPGGDELKSGASLLLTAGVPLMQDGRTLGYVGVGPTFLRTSGPGGSETSTGATLGLGIDHMLTDQWMLRGAVTYTAVDNLGSTDLDTKTLSAGVGLGFKF